MENKLGAALMYCEKRKEEMPKFVRKRHYNGKKQSHSDTAIWKLQEVLDKLNETINEKWQ